MQGSRTREGARKKVTLVPQVTVRNASTDEFLGDKRKTSDGDLLAFSCLFRCLARSCSQRQSVTRANVSGQRGIVCNFKIKLVPARSKSPSFKFLKKKSRMGICISNALIYTIYRVT